MITLAKARHPNVSGKTVLAPNMLKKFESIYGDVVIGGILMMKTKIKKGLFYLFMSYWYYAFSLKYKQELLQTLTCIERLFIKWPVSKF